MIDIFGDSLGDGIWEGIASEVRSLSDAKLNRHSVLGSGLAVGFAPWFKEFTESVKADQASVVILAFGINDAHFMRDDSSHPIDYKSAAWRTLYAARVKTIVQALEQLKVRGVWVGLPRMRDKGPEANAEYLNGIFQQVVVSDAVEYLSIDDLFLDPAGQYAQYLPDEAGKSRMVRADDGIHFSLYGYRRIANKLLQSLGCVKLITADK